MLSCLPAGSFRGVRSSRLLLVVEWASAAVLACGQRWSCRSRLATGSFLQRHLISDARAVVDSAVGRGLQEEGCSGLPSTPCQRFEPLWATLGEYGQSSLLPSTLWPLFSCDIHLLVSLWCRVCRIRVVVVLRAAHAGVDASPRGKQRQSHVTPWCSSRGTLECIPRSLSSCALGHWPCCQRFVLLMCSPSPRRHRRQKLLGSHACPAAGGWDCV